MKKILLFALSLLPILQLAANPVEIDILFVIPEYALLEDDNNVHTAHIHHSSAKLLAQSWTAQANTVYSDINIFNDGDSNPDIRFYCAMITANIPYQDSPASQLSSLETNQAVIDGKNRYGSDIVVLISPRTGYGLTPAAMASRTFAVENVARPYFSISTRRDDAYAVVAKWPSGFQYDLEMDYDFSHVLGRLFGGGGPYGSEEQNGAWEAYSKYADRYESNDGWELTVGTLMDNPGAASYRSHERARIISGSPTPYQHRTSGSHIFNTAVLYGETGVRDNYSTFQDSIPDVEDFGPSFIFIHEDMDVDEWWNTWFDWIQCDSYEYGHIFHVNHGWLYFDGSSNEGSFWYWDYEANGWYWTSKNYYVYGSGTYPWVYEHSNDRWLQYIRPTTNPRYFRDVNGNYITFGDNTLKTVPSSSVPNL